MKTIKECGREIKRLRKLVAVALILLGILVAIAMIAAFNPKQEPPLMVADPRSPSIDVGCGWFQLVDRDPIPIEIAVEKILEHLQLGIDHTHEYTERYPEKWEAVYYGQKTTGKEESHE